MASAPRILFVNHASVPAGAEYVLKDIVTEFPGSAVFLFEDGPFRKILEEQGTDVIVASGSNDMSRVRRDSNLLRTALPLVGSITSVGNQIRRASKNFDMVYANSQKAFVLAAAASGLIRKPLIWHCHDILTRQHFSRAQITLDIKLANICAAKVIAVSNATALAFVRAGGKRKLVTTLYNGVEPLPDSKCKRSKHAIRAAVGLPEGFLYGCFSRLAEWKGQHIAIQALVGLPDTAKCVIVGSPQFNEEAYGDGLRRLARSLGVSNRVIFMGHRSDVAEIMQAVDVYCHPSIAPEPFSLAVLEAMRAELPIAASNTGGIPEVIANKKTGMLATPNDAHSMAVAIGYLMNNPDEAAAMGAAAKQLVTAKFTIRTMKTNVRQIIQNVYNRKAAK
jgi:glycosyltransferase involved in cell wall biosynthesis